MKTVFVVLIAALMTACASTEAHRSSDRDTCGRNGVLPTQHITMCLVWRDTQ